MTVLEVLQKSTAFLKKRQVESPRLNAEHLLAHVLGRKRIELYLEFERALEEAELAPLREMVRRRSEGEPLQHLLGTVEFCGRTFLCDKRALVPRPETEALVELVESRMLNDGARVIDVGTGSGVIALCLAAKFPHATVYATDISDEALALARENAQRLGLESRVDFRKGDLLGKFSERFDVVVANLPYIPMHDRSSLPREVLSDPEAALFAGEQGNEVIRRLIEQAPAQLSAGGLIALEIGVGQSGSLCAFLAEKNFHDIEAKQDYSGIPRYIFARYG
jgi:release factor glutamine methyltransferase